MRSRLLALCALVATIGVIACEQILGLDKFTEIDATPCDACGDGGADVTADAPTADAFQLPDGVSEASSWARWRMDNTQGEVLDGASEASLANFIVTDAGIFDSVSGKLLWNPVTATGIATFAEALGHCASLGGAWRLPTRIELATLLDTTVATRPYVAPAFVEAGAVTADFFYTSSYVRPITTTIRYWYVDFSNGDVTIGLEQNGGVICVVSLL